MLDLPQGAWQNVGHAAYWTTEQALTSGYTSRRCSSKWVVTWGLVARGPRLPWSDAMGHEPRAMSHEPACIKHRINCATSWTACERICLVQGWESVCWGVFGIPLLENNSPFTFLDLLLFVMVLVLFYFMYFYVSVFIPLLGFFISCFYFHFVFQKCRCTGFQTMSKFSDP